MKKTTDVFISLHTYLVKIMNQNEIERYANLYTKTVLLPRGELLRAAHPAHGTGRYRSANANGSALPGNILTDITVIHSENFIAMLMFPIGCFKTAGPNKPDGSLSQHVLITQTIHWTCPGVLCVVVCLSVAADGRSARTHISRPSATGHRTGSDRPVPAAPRHLVVVVVGRRRRGFWR